MPIIINDFEIIPGPAPKAEEAAPPSPPPPPAPEDIERMDERHFQRLLRLWAD